MTLSGHPFARSVRLVAWMMTVSFAVLAADPRIAFAQAAQGAPPAPGPAPAQPAPAAPVLPPPVPAQPAPVPGAPATPPPGMPAPEGTPMTLDQAAPVVTPTPAPQGQGIVQRIVIEGTQRIEPDSVLSYLLLHQGQPYDPATADRSLKVLFDTGLFADVRMTWDGSSLTVRVVENPILNQVVYEGNGKLSDTDLNKEVQVRPRMVFTRARVQADVQRIIELYRRAGRFAATVEPKIIQRPQNRVDLIFEINEGPTTGVSRISFIGNKVFSDSDLREQIATTTSAWWKFLTTNDNYDPDRLTFDREQLRRFYLSHGYADFRVVSAVAELTPDRQSFYITFTVDEGQIYHFGKISVTSQIRDLNPSDLQPLLTTPEGEIYDAEQIDKSIEALTYAAGTKGFVFVDIRPRVTRNPQTQTIDLVYEIDPAPRVYIDRINIVGNTRTRDEVIRREFRLAEGDAFNRVLADRSRTRVRALGFFRDVTIKEDPGSAPDRTVLTVTVTEQPTGELSLGAGYSSQQGLLLDFSYTERNLFGRGQFLRASVSIGTFEKDYDLRFTEPYFLGRPLAAGFLAYKIITDFTNYIGYISDVTAAGINFGFPISEFGRLSPHYNFAYTNIQATSSASASILLSQGHYSASSVGYTYTYDTRDDAILPTKGWDFALSQDIAGLSGDLKYLRSVVGVEYYHPFFFGLVGEAALNAGYVSAYGGQTIPINERFFKGGATFRGFQIAGVGPRDVAADAALGGQLYAVGTYQVRLPDILPADYGIKLALFSDFGTVGVLRGVQKVCNFFQCVKDQLAPRATAGLAVNWKSPFGPVEIDFALPFVMQSYDKPQAVRLSAGTQF